MVKTNTYLVKLKLVSAQITIAMNFKDFCPMVLVKLAYLTQEYQEMEDTVRMILAMRDNESNEMVHVKHVMITLELLQMEYSVHLIDAITESYSQMVHA